jgi:hypothetical protein
MIEITYRMNASTHQLTVRENGTVTKDIDVSKLSRKQRNILARNMALWQEMKGQ